MKNGFTLIEMVLAMIVTSILVLGMANLTGIGTRGYFESIDRYRVQNEARFVLEKLSREVRHAVPNLFSAENDENCISFFPIYDGGFYALSGADINFIVSDFAQVNSQSASLSIVINPTQPYTDIGAIDNVFAIADATVSGATFTLAGQAPTLTGGSVSQRHYVFDTGNEVNYCINGSQITRNDTTVSNMLVNGAGSSINYEAATVQRSGLVEMIFVFGTNGEQTQFEQEVQVVNVP